MRTGYVPDQLRTAPFTTAFAAGLGVTRSALHAGSEWRHVFRDVWLHRDVEISRELRLAAVRLVIGPDVFICGPTAAWLYGVDVQDRRNDLIWVGCRTGHRLRTRVGCTVRELSVVPADLQLVDGVLLTTPLRTCFDCARWLSPVEGTVVADQLAHQGAIAAEELARYAAGHRALRGVRGVDAVLLGLEPLAESPMETRLRLLIVHWGLPRPQAQHVITDNLGRFVARADLAYPDQMVVVEYDGALHWEQRRADDRRRDAMRSLGWTVIVVSASDYYDTPEATVRRISRALAAAHGESSPT